MRRVNKGLGRLSSTAWTRPASVVGLLLATALLLLAPAGAASAHDALEGTDPADGAVLTEAPSQVVLTFTADQLAVGAAVAVTGPDGAQWVDEAPVVDGLTVTQPIAPGMPAGAYSVEWRSVSGDGHPTGGTFTFTLALPEVPLTEATAAATAMPSPDVVPEAQETITAVEEDVAADGPEAGDDGPGAALVVGGVAAILLVAAGIAVVVRRRGPAA